MNVGEYANKKYVIKLYKCNILPEKELFLRIKLVSLFRFAISVGSDP